MSEEIIAGILIALFFAGFFFMVYKLVKNTNRRIADNFQKLANKYNGLSYSKDKMGQYGLKNGPLLLGTIREMPFKCFTHGNGDSSWTKFELTHGLEIKSYQLRLANEHIFYKMGKKMNLVKELELGVQDFDKRFLIQSDNPSTTRALLNRQIRDKILELPKLYFWEMHITNTQITYQLPMQIVNDELYKHYANAIDIALLIFDELRRINR